MKTITWNGHRLEMFDSVQDTAIKRFQLYNLNTMLDAGIGADLNAFNARINSVRELMGKKPDLAQIELNNLQQAVYFIMRNTSPAMRSFVAMIHRLDGREITDQDLSGGGIDSILEELNRKRLTARTVFDFLAAGKKKWIASWRRFFRRSSTLRRSRNIIPG